jgi:hypothetical protein
MLETSPLNSLRMYPLFLVGHRGTESFTGSGLSALEGRKRIARERVTAVTATAALGSGPIKRILLPRDFG